MLYNTQHLYFILPLRVLCSASLLPNSRPGCPVPGISVAEESPPVSCTREFRERDSFLSPSFLFSPASNAGFSLSGAPHVRAADTLSIASGLNPDILYSLRAPDLPDFPEKTPKIPSPSCICPKFVVPLQRFLFGFLPKIANYLFGFCPNTTNYLFGFYRIRYIKTLINNV